MKETLTPLQERKAWGSESRFFPLNSVAQFRSFILDEPSGFRGVGSTEE